MTRAEIDKMIENSMDDKYGREVVNLVEVYNDISKRKTLTDVEREEIKNILKLTIAIVKKTAGKLVDKKIKKFFKNLLTNQSKYDII